MCGAVDVNRGYTDNGLNQFTQSPAFTCTYDARGSLGEYSQFKTFA
jgi:hypothetical protein